MIRKAVFCDICAGVCQSTADTNENVTFDTKNHFHIGKRINDAVIVSRSYGGEIDICENCRICLQNAINLKYGKYGTKGEN